MAADFNAPNIEQTEAAYAQSIRDIVIALALGLASTPSNTPTGAIRWSAANARWEQFDGTSWSALASLYKINADTLDGSHASAFATAGHNHAGVYQPLDAELTALASLASAANTLPYFTGSGAAATTSITTSARSLLACASADAMREALGVQPLDATLIALAAVSTSANQLIYATGADTFSTTSITTSARSLLACASADAMREALGVQPLDATLIALAAVSTSANQLIYATGADTFSTTSITTAARSLLACASADAMRKALGINSAALYNVGTAANNIVQLDSSGRLPAVDGSQLEGISAGLEACTADEAVTGTINTKAVTPLQLRHGLNASGTAPVYAARAFAHIKFRTFAVYKAANMTITRNSDTSYTIVFATAMSDAYYAIITQMIYDNSSNIVGVPIVCIENKTASGFKVTFSNVTSSDHAQASLAIFG